MALMLDSNIIIYSLLPGHEKLREFIATNLSAFSAISYVEVLGFHGITAVDRDSFVQLLTASNCWKSIARHWSARSHFDNSGRCPSATRSSRRRPWSVTESC